MGTDQGDALFEAERVVPGALVRTWDASWARRLAGGQRIYAPNMMLPAPTKTTLKSPTPDDCCTLGNAITGQHARATEEHRGRGGDGC